MSANIETHEGLFFAQGRCNIPYVQINEKSKTVTSTDEATMVELANARLTTNK